MRFGLDEGGCCLNLRREQAALPDLDPLITSTKTLASLAVPDFFLTALLPSFHACSPRNCFRITGGGFLNVASFILRDLGKRAASEDRCRRDFCDVLFCGVVVLVLD